MVGIKLPGVNRQRRIRPSTRNSRLLADMNECSYRRKP